MIFFAAIDGVLNFQAFLEYLAYIVAIVLVTVIATLWISGNRATLRRTDRRPEEPQSGSSWRSRLGLNEGKRRRRRAHRRRNPTLAETGGLPPIRAESSAPPAENYQN